MSHPGVRTLLGLLALLLPLAAHGESAREKRTDRHGDALPEHALVRLGTTFLRHGYSVNVLALSADGKLLASAGSDHSVRLWDLSSGKQLRVLGAENARIEWWTSGRWFSCLTL